MLCEYQLENFKAFAGPETMPIRPITLIYGPNSSGKSSILQSLLMLKQTLEEADSSTSLLPKGKLVDLGNYREFVHRHDVSRNFSFAMFFTFNPEEAELDSAERLLKTIDSEEMWSSSFNMRLDFAKRLLKTVGSAPLGLKVNFAYNEEAKIIRSSSVDILIDDKSMPVFSYSPVWKYEDTKFLMKFNVHPEHSFWRVWWASVKQDVKEALGRPPLDLDPLDFWTSERRDGEAGRVRCHRVFYKGKHIGPNSDHSDEEVVKAIKELAECGIWQDLEDYSLEAALVDLWIENESSGVGYRNFLPVSIDLLSPEVALELEALEEESRKTGQAQQSESPWPVNFNVPQSLMSVNHELFLSARIYNTSSRGAFKPRQRLDVTPITLQVCSAFQQLVKNMIYLGPLRNSPERYYTFSGNLSEQVGQFGEQMPDVLFRNREVVERVNAEFDRFGLGYELKLSELKDEDSNSSNVFALRVVDKGTGVSASIRDVGFGVSQVLPIIVQSLLSQNKTLLIEQPEIHLHPALQAELGDLFIKSALGEQKNTFILETHSEHLLLRILRRIRETTEGELELGLTPIRPDDVAVLYVLPDKDGAKVVEIPIQPDGEFAAQWPQGFFAERAKELF